MSLAWGAVLDTLLRTVETAPDRAKLERIVVVRDLRGRVRLAARPAPGVAPDPAQLEQSIASGLGGWFAGPILWTTAASAEEARLARNLVEQHRSWPAGWPQEWDDGIGRRQPISSGLWVGEQRVRSKDAWLAREPVKPPWPLLDRTPAIVSFYSFKGGVGRSTTLGIAARQLARAGHSVVAVDLDLEAPGLGRLFDVRTERGVLDLLAEHMATGKIDTTDLDLHHDTLEVGGGSIAVYPVGPMDWSYVERLACLDYAPRPGAGPSAVESAIREVLRLIRQRHTPHYILLDARAGLHDLGGLSIHALSHVDVLVGRASGMTLDGFELSLHALSRRRRAEDLRVVMVQSFVPLPLEEEDHKRAREAWRAELYDLCAATIYQKLYADTPDDLPGVSDDTAIHHPWPIPAYDGITRVERISDVDESIQQAPAFTALVERIVEQCARSLSPVDDEETELKDGREVPE